MKTKALVEVTLLVNVEIQGDVKDEDIIGTIETMNISNKLDGGRIIYSSIQSSKVITVQLEK